MLGQLRYNPRVLQTISVGGLAVAFISLGTVGTTARQQTPHSAATAILVELQRETRTPGISAAVAVGGVIVYSTGVGLADLEHQVPASADTVYGIGSVSKPMTAVAVMQLVERGLVDLDHDIRAYVPEFPDKGQVITIRHLLTHTSGIRHYRNTDFPGTPDVENIWPVNGFRDGLRFFANDPLLFRPGAYFLYSSYGVNLLEGVVEKASGLKFEQYMQRHVWGPAGMTATRFNRPEVIVPHRARAYRFENQQPLNYYYNDIRYKFASGGMMSTAADLARFASALNLGRLLSRNSRDQMLSPQTAGLLAFREDGRHEKQVRPHGFLWDLRQDDHGRFVAYHCGSVSAFNACVVDFVDENIVAAIATNSWECCGWRKADELAAIFRAAR